MSIFWRQSKIRNYQKITIYEVLTYKINGNEIH